MLFGYLLIAMPVGYNSIVGIYNVLMLNINKKEIF